MLRVRTLLVCAVLLGSMASCASSNSAGAFEGGGEEVVTIRVRNQQLEEARVYLYLDGQRQRLGSVRGNDTRTFRHPIDGLRRVNIEFDITLGARCVTRGVSLGPGDSFEMTIPSILNGFDGSCGR
ncbi:MAG: hypothetical protein AAF389_19650 [Gemmatimonadota bacterium]